MSAIIRPHRYLCKIFLPILVAAFMIGNVCYSQPGKNTPGEIEIAFYKMRGQLQIFNLENKQAKINDLTWELSDTFITKDIPNAWKNKGIVEFTKQKVWVYYYVSLFRAASFVGKKDTDKKPTKLITNPAEIQKIRELGGKIYKLEMIPS